MYIITAAYQGRRVKRTAFSDFQAWVIINTLTREGCTGIAMREITKEDYYACYAQE